MIDEAAPIQIQLLGGPFDGDEVILSPHLSVTPPDVFEYFGSEGGEAGFYRYEPNGLGAGNAWKEEETSQHWLYCGFKPLTKEDQQ